MTLEDDIKLEFEKRSIKLRKVKKGSFARTINHLRRGLANIIPDTYLGLRIKNTILPLGYTGSNCKVRNGFRFHYGKNIYICDNVFINYDCLFLDSDIIFIEENVAIGPHVDIYTISHFSNWEGKFDSSRKPVYIKKNSWVGGHSTILPGIVIGEGSIVGAGSVVTNSIEPYTLYAGNPAIKKKDLIR